MTVRIMRRSDIADPEATTVARSLADLGYDEVSEVRTGREFILEIDSDDSGRVRERVGAMCEEILANPVIEDYEVLIGDS
ncbi:MAG: phosphoribosylformylglycinamidine synthase subunit PurS [Acidimicrobiia bacterium]|nr:phosphoribosylformylglycinamidine synthase subunit PurS [Acidimicrobiia bacterium]